MSKSQPWDYFPLLPIFAFTDVKKLKKFVKKKTGIKLTITGKSGQCTLFEYDGDGFCTILLDVNENESATRKIGLLTHECVHYAQYYAEMAGTPLDDETQAYVTQSAVCACINQIGEEWFATPQTLSNKEK